MNKPKAKGTAAETAVARWLQSRGVDATRAALAGANDQGDVHIRLAGGTVTTVIEVKAHENAATGQPGAAQLEKWMREADTALANVTTSYSAFLIVKRKGTTDVGKWWCYWRPGSWLNTWHCTTVEQIDWNQP